MKKIILSTTLLATTIFAFNLQPVKQNELKKIQSTITVFKNKNINVNKGYFLKEANLYLLNTQIRTPRGVVDIPAYVPKNKDIAFVGTAYYKGKKLTMPKDVKAIKEGVAFTAGSGEKGELYVFTDPECPFCQQMEQTQGDKLKQYKAHFILFPLSFHKNAKAMTYYILQGKDDKEKRARLVKIAKGDNTWRKALNIKTEKDIDTFNKIVLNQDTNKTDIKRFFGSKENLQKFQKYLEKATKAFNEVGARGTPSLYNKNFEPVNRGSL